jgi:hypothetical protein
MRRLKIAAGFLLMALGGVMLVTPGPGWLAVGSGLGILASEYDWARRWLGRIRSQGEPAAHAVLNWMRRSSR